MSSIRPFTNKLFPYETSHENEFSQRSMTIMASYPDISGQVRD